MLPRVGIAIGDPAGVGPEIALKAALDGRVMRICRPVLFGDPRAIAAHAATSGIASDVETVALDHFRDEPLAIERLKHLCRGQPAESLIPFEIPAAPKTKKITKPELTASAEQGELLL